MTKTIEDFFTKKSKPDIKELVDQWAKQLDKCRNAYPFLMETVFTQLAVYFDDNPNHKYSLAFYEGELSEIRCYLEYQKIKNL